ncbi:nitrilase-related carbon-nitrogen hydrolase [Corynebacterium aquilae]|uniref:nitrilase-related carbon-nitrogen hydrolase n=1 Tax=Corynebacterium aquilae TaxID=203263 RepID=UPI0009522CEA|nr:nitrilase-related carbon-nitrogen hydrolase [Corynebacterium aquilae]
MRISLVQMTSGKDVPTNIERACDFIREAAEKGSSLVVFPEATMASFAVGKLDGVAAEYGDTFAARLQATARECGVVAVAGMFSPADTVQRNGKTIHRVENLAGIFGLDAQQFYAKFHCYDAFGFRESDTVRAGEDLVVFEVDGVKVGVAICFDIRFPEQFVRLAQLGAEVIVVPASWAQGPGKAEQWELLARARALDSTSFVLACDQGCPADEDPESPTKVPLGVGRSVVVAPNGQVEHRAGSYEEVVHVDIDLDKVGAMRAQVPVVAMREDMPVVGLHPVSDQQ